MARHLQQHIQAGKDIEEGKSWPATFTGAEILTEEQFGGEQDGIYSLQFSPDNEKLAVGFGGGAIRLYNFPTGKMIKELRKTMYGGLQIMCIRFHPKNPDIFLAATSKGIVHLCNAETGECTEKFTEDDNQAKGRDGTHFNQINCLDFDKDGDTFATAGKDLCVRIYDANTFQLIRKYEGISIETDLDERRVAMRVFSLKYHPTEKVTFVTGGWDNQLQIWDSREESGIQKTIPGPHICGDSIDLKENSIVTGSWVRENPIQEWDWGSGKCIRDIPFKCSSKEGAYIYCTKYCDNDVIMAGGSGTSSVQAIDKQTGNMIAEIEMKGSNASRGPVFALDTTMGGRRFAMGGHTDKLILGSLY